MSRIQDHLQKMIQKKEQNKKHLQQKAKQIHTAVKNLRGKLNRLLDTLEKNTTHRIESMLEELEKQVDDELKIGHSLTNQMKKTSNTINTKGKTNEVIAFCGMKKGKGSSKEAELFLRSVSGDATLTFTPYMSIEGVLSSLALLGEIASNTVVTRRVHSLSSIQPTSDVATVSAVSHDDHVYSVEKVEKYAVKTMSDRCVRVSGICFLPGGNVVVSDFNNDNLKLLNDKYSVIDQYDTPRPTDVCHIAGTEVAVSVCVNVRYNDHEIWSIKTVQGKWTCTRTFKIQGCIDSFTYHGGQFYVANYSGLFVYTLYGTLVKQLYSGSVNRVTVSVDGHRIYLSNYHDSLITLDATGKVLSTLKDPELRHTTGVALASNGTVFVCGRDSNVVIQADRNGRKKLATLAKAKDGVDCPCALGFNKKTNELVVTQDSDKTHLLVLRLK